MDINSARTSQASPFEAERNDVRSLFFPALESTADHRP